MSVSTKRSVVMSFFFFLTTLLTTCQTPETRSPDWSHLSSASSDIPAPGPSLQQTASLVLDVDQDGRNDFIIGSRKTGPSLLWYQRHTEGWTRYTLEPQTLPIEAGGAFHDIDRDGDLDLVFGADSKGNSVWWWENPYPAYAPGTPWTRREIKHSGANKHHDQIFGDFDNDGQTELVFWNQKANTLFLAEIPNNPRESSPWPARAIFTSPSESEGLACIDINGDGTLNLVGGGCWFEHQGGGDFIPHLIDETQRFSRAAAGQLKEGGWAEVVFVIGDGTGPLVWYEWTGASWEGHTLLETVDHGHSLAVADINNDGAPDIFCGEMRLGKRNKDAKIWIFFGDGTGNFLQEEIAVGYGVHEAKVADLDGDGTLDILGKPYIWQTPRLDVWLQRAAGTNSADGSERWRRHVVDAKKPWKAVFIAAADVNRDQQNDIITGGWWYRHPGKLDGEWIRTPIGEPLHNMAAVYDVDQDGDLDILGTRGEGSTSDARFAWAQNDGSGNFTVFTNIAQGDGDFLQGVALAPFQQNGPVEVALSWHKAEKGIQMLTLPENPAAQTWPWHKIAEFSQDECLSAGDIDGDGNIDLLLGTRWLRNTGQTWELFSLSSRPEPPDRNRLADINGDGALDAVVGFEATSKQGKLVWYEQGDLATEPWIEHIIASIIGPMSLDAADMDGDGDIDIVAGEHNLATPDRARLYLFENADGQGGRWESHLLSIGDEHHDGTRVVDMDADGDLDILSIGWGHSRVLLYENPTISPRN